jgi:hypothetical protein
VVKMILKELRESGLAPAAEADAVMTEGAAASSEPAMSEGAAASATGEMLIEFAGGPELLAGGRVRLPLTIRYGRSEKRVALNISLSSDDE